MVAAGRTALYKEKEKENLQRSIYEMTTSSLSFCLGSRAELTGAKWRIWDLLKGNLALLNVEFLKTKELTHIRAHTLTHTNKVCMFVLYVLYVC